jgi:hypothetical protein
VKNKQVTNTATESLDECRPMQMHACSETGGNISSSDNGETAGEVIAETVNFHEGPDSDAELCNYTPVLDDSISNDTTTAGRQLRPRPQ